MGKGTRLIFWFDNILSCTFDIFIPFSPAAQLHFLHDGILGGSKYRNTVRKNGKYRNAASTIDEIPIARLSISRACLSQAALYQKSSSAIATLHCNVQDLILINRTIEKPGHWMQRQFYCRLNIRNCVIIYKLFITFEAYLFCAA